MKDNDSKLYDGKIHGVPKAALVNPSNCDPGDRVSIMVGDRKKERGLEYDSCEPSESRASESSK